MKRRNPLATVLRLRDIEERRAAADAARAEIAVRLAGERIDATRRAYEARPLADAPLNAIQLRALELQGVGALEAVAEAVASADAAAHKRGQALEALTRAGIRRKSVERLADRRNADSIAAAQTAASRAMDELAVLRRAAAWS